MESALEPRMGRPAWGQGLGKVDGCLPSELHHRRRGHVVHRLVVDDVANSLLVQGLEVEPVAGVEVGGYSLRIRVDHHAGDAGLGQRPGGVDAAVVELDALADADGAAADDYCFVPGYGQGLVFLFVGAVIVGRNGLETRQRRYPPSCKPGAGSSGGAGPAPAPEAYRPGCPPAGRKSPTAWPGKGDRGSGFRPANGVPC